MPGARPESLAVMKKLRFVPIALAVWTMSAAVVLPGCRERRVETPPSRTAAPTYTGPVYLRGTVGSVARLRGYQPLPVSGYGVVVNLRGTGSSEVPAVIRQRLLNDLRRRGVGSSDSPLPDTSPEQVLANANTAVVRVVGLIPPGASRGTSFDLLVTAADTQTTSLAGGDLWPVDLSIAGDNPQVDARTLAEAEGPVYVDPVSPPDSAEAMGRAAGFERQAVVLSGGRAVQPRGLELVLNQASYRRARAIEQRINERYPAAPGDRRATAEAESDVIVRINIPARWERRPAEFLRLIEHLYLDRSAGFIPYQARTLANVLRERPDEVERITFAWRSLGPNAAPALRDFYDDQDFTLRFAALRAGAFLEDERAGIELTELADHRDPAIRIRVAEALLNLPESLRAAETLADLLDDADPDVRVAAYEAMAVINDPMLDRVPVGDRDRVKFILDRVPAERPMIYVSHARQPRLAVFDPGLVFAEPMLARLWDNRLMLRVEESNGPLTVFYQKPGQTRGETHKLRPDLATLIFFLAHEPNERQPQPGLDLSYGQIVDVVHTLCRQGVIDAPFLARVSPLAQRVAEARREAESGRPEVTPLDPDADLEGPSLEDLAE